MRRSELDLKFNAWDKVLGFFSPGRAFRNAHARALIYDAASTSRHNRKRNKTGGSGDDHLTAEKLWTLRETSRELDKNNGIAISCIDRSVENVMGSDGFDTQPNTGNDDLDKRLTEDWNSFVEVIDSRGEFHGEQQFSRSYRTELRDGDGFWEWDSSANNFDGGLLFFEGDRVLSPRRATKISGFKLHNGVARDKRGKPRFYWLCDHSPKSEMVDASKGRAIKAERIIHCYDPRRFSQSRSVPIVTPVIREFDDLDDLLMYERIGAKLVAAQGYFVETDDPDGFRQMANPDSADGEPRTQAVDPGSIHYLGKGEQIKSVESNRPSAHFVDFVNLINRCIGLPLGLPYELVLLDFSHVNFASSRQLLNQAQRHFQCEQVKQGFRRTSARNKWLAQRIAQGHYSQYDVENMYRHSWGYPGWPSPNPLQDAMAASVGIENEFESRTNFNRSRNVKQEQIEKELALELGVTVESLPTLAKSDNNIRTLLQTSVSMAIANEGGFNAV